MCGTCSIRRATIVLLGALAILWGAAAAASSPGAAEVLEVRVLDARVQPGQGERADALYRMEVLSVLRSASRVDPGETVTVRTSGGTATLEQGWMGTAYLNPDPDAAGAARRFVTAPRAGNLVELPPGPPSFTFTREAPRAGK